MSENTFMGVPREKIPWFPTIDYQKCNYCMECDKFCPHHVFERHEAEERKLLVANPNNCVVFCRACAKTCGPDAISFPEKPAIVAMIKKTREAEKGSP
jgi:NAD-dependent dihydropyrimidine dehydrogenase PreA subunit